MAGTTIIATVVTAAASTDLVALADVKEELQISGGKDDRWLKKQIGRASAFFSRNCNRVFQLQTYQNSFWPNLDPYPWQLPSGFMPLQLTAWPIVAMVSVVENFAAPSALPTTLVEGTDYLVDSDQGQLTRLFVDGNPARWDVPVQAQFSAGYAEIPDDLQDATIRMVKARVYARGRDPALRQENAAGIYEATYWFGTGPGSRGNLPPDIEEIIENYRVPVVA